jgi:hypothetical protein
LVLALRLISFGFGTRPPEASAGVAASAKRTTIKIDSLPEA